MSKHTPGPWRTYLDVNKDQWTVQVNDHFVVANCGIPGNAYVKANAKLIAAAPEMLELLKSLADTDDVYLEYDLCSTNFALTVDRLAKEAKELIDKLC